MLNSNLMNEKIILKSKFQQLIKFHPLHIILSLSKHNIYIYIYIYIYILYSKKIYI